MQIGPFHFRPSPFIALVTAVVVIALSALGFWQLDRAEGKASVLETYRERRDEPAVRLDLSAQPSEQRYRHVEVRGRFDTEHQFLLDNQVREGHVGYDVLTPLRLAGRDQAVLVNRGWVPLEGSREIVPDVEVTAEPVQLSGTVYVPYGEGYRLGEMDAGEIGWPRRVQYLDFEAMEERLGYPLADLTVRLDPGEPYGYERDWQAVPFGPERHIAYAVQWFAMALAVVVIFISLNLKRGRAQ